MFENEITIAGYTYALIKVYRNARGYMVAEYYSPISPYSQWAHITGPFVSESI